MFVDAESIELIQRNHSSSIYRATIKILPRPIRCGDLSVILISSFPSVADDTVPTKRCAKCFSIKKKKKVISNCNHFVKSEIEKT